MQDVPPKEGLQFQDVPKIHYQDAIGRLWEVAPRGPLYHQVFKIPSDARKGAYRPSVISIPGLSDSGVGRLEVPDKEEDTQGGGVMTPSPPG